MLRKVEIVPSGSVAIPNPVSPSPPQRIRVILLALTLGAALLWFFSRALFASNFLPHWYCYIGNTRLVWTNVLADFLIGLSYVVISCTLALLVRRTGGNLPYQGFFWAFGVFIVSCGATHFMEVLTIWKPVYWLSALVKVITALASAATAVVLVIATPEILGFVRTARESAARAGNEKFRALVEAAPLAVFSYDMLGNLTSWNVAAEKMFGYSAQEVLGKRNPVLPAELAAQEMQLFQKILAGEVIHSYETVRRRADSTSIPVNASAAPLFAEDGSIVGIMSVVEDISEAKSNAAQARQSQKLEVLGRLAGGVAHDFNNMLMVLDSSTELLERSLPPSSVARMYLDQIQRTSAKAAAITRQLLAFSRKQVVEFRPMDLHAALAQCEFMLPRLLGSDIELSFDHSAQHSWIRSDPGQIEQVVANLAINARDAMPNGGRLAISTRNQSHSSRSKNDGMENALCVVLEVADNGSGMDEKTRAQMFDPFFSTKPPGKGTGLGLSTVYGIVKQSGGFIQVHSAIGLGTRFEISFPVDTSPRPENVQPSENKFSGPAPHATILLADDESALRHAVAEILRQTGYTVLEAPTALDALNLAQSHPQEINVLLTDIVMPGLRGTELAAKVRAYRPHIKVIFMSGYAEGISETEHPSDAFYLQKPFRFAAMLDLLRTALNVN
ncbi:MAG: PAS domain S-box protein [Acidobacteria bacterium]|nr:PAS domain S-box protein [Acidobacteriota bacterium]MBS1864524.1 PAS domain S-box protein [Acidobacteriota bacterium]